MSEKPKASVLAGLKKGPALILLAALGVGLILWGGSDRVHATQKEEVEAERGDALSEYTDDLERRMTLLCEQVKGVSDVRVAVCLEGDLTYVYATDSELRGGGEGEQQSKLSYVTVGSGSSEQTVLLTRRFPRVCGVGIVCKGGGHAEVRQELILLLEAAYGVSSNNIYITEANP